MRRSRALPLPTAAARLAGAAAGIRHSGARRLRWPRRSSTARGWRTSHYENFLGRHLVSAQASAPALLQRLCLLPHLRRPGRRGRRQAAVADSAGPVGSRTAAVLFRRAAPSRVRRLARDGAASSTFRSTSSPICCRRSARTRSSPAIRASTTCWDIARTRRILSAIWCCTCAVIAMPERQQLSDYTCTALQLANFWQDVASRLRQGPNLSSAGRLRQVWRQRKRHCAAARDAAVSRHDEVRSRARARVVSARTCRWPKWWTASLALDIELFSRGGLAILDAIERQGYDVLNSRPVISKPRKLWLVARAALGNLL